MVFKNDKKGMEASFTMLTAVIIVAVILILISVILINISRSGEEAAQDSKCRASVMSYARLGNMPLGDVAADESTINCPTKYVTLDETNANDQRRHIADLMAQCWNNFGEGKLRLFSAQDEKFCVICSVFEFEDKNVKLTGLPSFLMTERTSYKIDDRHPTYQEYFTGVQTKADLIDLTKKSIDTNYFDGGKRYGIMFTFYKQSYWSKIKGALVGGLIGGAALVVGAGVAVATGGLGIPAAAWIISGGVTAGATVGAATSGGGQGGGWTTSGADWDANIVMSEYTVEGIKAFGCNSLPISQIDERFK